MLKYARRFLADIIEPISFRADARVFALKHHPGAIRKQLGLSQAEFAARFGFKLDAVQNWEQGRRRPEGAARAFLRVIEREPEAVQRALTE